MLNIKSGKARKIVKTEVKRENNGFLIKKVTKRVTLFLFLIFEKNFGKNNLFYFIHNIKIKLKNKPQHFSKNKNV